VPDQVDLSPRLGERFLNRVIELASNQQVRTLGVEIYARKKRLVSDACQPLMQGRQINIRAEKGGEDDHSGTVARRGSQSVIDRCGVEQHQLGRKQHFAPDRNIRLLILLSANIGSAIPGSEAAWFHRGAILLYVSIRSSTTRNWRRCTRA